MSEHKVIFFEELLTRNVKQLLTGRVNAILEEAEFSIPIIEYSPPSIPGSVTPVVAHTSCERTEKERLIRVYAYTLTITFYVLETPESELHLYAYAGAVSRAVCDNPSLGGIADRVEITGTKYIPPKKPNCGQEWELVITLRITKEKTIYDS